MKFINKKISCLVIIGIFSVFSFLSCKTTKQIVQKPNWLLYRPVNPDYYIGIGSVLKNSNVNEYQQMAKKNALNDLAGEISVTISNTSFLYKLSVNDIYKDTYDSKTQTSTNEALEGYELVETFDDQNNYWVYYKLSKQKYQEIKQQRIQKALDNALSKFGNAANYKKEQQFYNTLILLIKAVEDIKPYLSEPLLTKYQGKDIYFGNELFNEILLCLNELKIQSTQKEITVKRGQIISDELLTFIVTDKKENKIENIPIVAEYTGGALVNDKSQSSNLGLVSFTIPKVKSKKNIDYFTVKVDLTRILQEATNDFFIKKLLKNYKTSEFSKQVNIKNPIFFVNSTEKKFDKIENITNLKEACNVALTSANIEITKNQKEADYIIEISSNTKQSDIVNNMYNVSLDAIITVKNMESKTLYQRNMNSIKGTQLSFESANLEAYTNAIDYLKKRIIPDVLEQLF